MRKTRARNYRHKVTIQQNTVSRGTTGEAVDSWAFFASRWASVEPLTGRELFAAQQFQSDSTVKIRMRHDDIVDGLDVRDYRITFNSKTYDLQSIINVFENNQELHIMCNIHNE